MSNKFLLPVCLVAFALLSLQCGDKEEDTVQDADVSMRVLLEYKDDPVVMFEEMIYPVDDLPFIVSSVEFYASDMALVGDFDSNRQVELREISRFDFTINNQTAAGAAAGLETMFERVPLGVYEGLRFDVGVSADLNAVTPEEYAQTHPLAVPGNYWSAWGSYIFAKIEGRSDADGDGAYESPMTFHVGGDNLLRTAAVEDEQITVAAGSDNAFTLVLDLETLLQDGNGYLDIVNNGFSHSNPNDLNQIGLSTTVVNNFSRAFDVE